MKEKVDKVVEFAQSESKAKKFSHIYPISDEVKGVMLNEVYGDFTKYVLVRNYSEFQSILKEYVDSHYLRVEKREALEQNLFWWRVLYDSNQNSEMSCVESYISENYHRLRNKSLITSWLREWDRVMPKFYYVGYKYNDRVLVVVDILTEETLDVIVYDPLAIPPKKGEIVMGTLIPLGDALYFPIIDFYHFDVEASEDIAKHIHHYFDIHLKTSTMHEAFIHVLSVALQIERLVLMESQENVSSK
ncbi:hypothetical protein ACFQ3N_16875 [Virgibacillus byunsanensis]|uniref:Phage protein n=1 Tax=Virgibacillus byunsanensis TaxID=570945 RepID=A0ABW3LQG3_9BACI